MKMLRKIMIPCVVSLIFISGCSGSLSTSPDTSETEQKAGKKDESLSDFPVLEDEKITKEFWKQSFDSYDIEVCLDSEGTLHIVYVKDNIRYSLCRKDNFSDDSRYIYEENIGEIESFYNVLGCSGVKVKMPVEKDVLLEAYIAMDDGVPRMLVTEYCNAPGLTEADTDGDGQKELLREDGMVYR